MARTVIASDFSSCGSPPKPPEPMRSMSFVRLSMVIVWCRACLSVGWRDVPASCEHFALRSLMRDWIREASEGVIWIVPGADLEDIVMSWVGFFFFSFVVCFCSSRWVCRSLPVGYSFFSRPSLSTVHKLCSVEKVCSLPFSIFENKITLVESSLVPVFSNCPRQSFAI
jgi:hypothetical protein